MNEFFRLVWSWLNKVNTTPKKVSTPESPVASTTVIRESPVQVRATFAYPLRYQIAVDDPLTGGDGEITEVGYNGPLPKQGIGVRYCNLYDQTGTNRYGPYLKGTDTADQYSEKVVDPNGGGWTKLLADQCDSAIAGKFKLIEWDNPDGYDQKTVLSAVSFAALHGLQVLAKNPLSCSWDSVPYVAHPAVVGVIVEHGENNPADMDALRKKAGKPDLPVWFVSFKDKDEDGKSWADQIAKLIVSYKYMWVTYSPDGEYTSSKDVAGWWVENFTPKPIVQPPAMPVSPITSDGPSRFASCVKLTLVSEGGNDDDPHDPGGRTSRGITAGDWTEWRKTHPGLPSDVWQAPQDQILAIYKSRYWDAMNCDSLAPGMDYCVFDCAVLDGLGRAKPWVIAVAALDTKAAINKFCDLRLARLQALSGWARYGRGWGSRVASVRHDALAMVKGLPVEPPKPILNPDSTELHDLGHRIKRTMLAKGYPWFDDQNVVSVENMNPDGSPCNTGPNTFDDIKMVLDGDGKIIGGPWEGTTHPGTYWTEHPMASGGAFIIALGPQACWTPGPYHDHEVWRQAEDSSIMGHRDPNETYKRQGEPVKHGDIGVHHHGGYNLPKSNIANAAAGCQVIRLTDKQQDFMNLTKKCPRYLKDPKGYRLMATVLEFKDILP